MTLQLTRNENKPIARMVLKRNKVWKGIHAKSSEVRTYELDVPKGRVTIRGMLFRRQILPKCVGLDLM